jgi:hypothetical protein
MFSKLEYFLLNGRKDKSLAESSSSSGAAVFNRRKILRRNDEEVLGIPRFRYQVRPNARDGCGAFTSFRRFHLFYLLNNCRANELVQTMWQSTSPKVYLGFPKQSY